MLIDQANEVIKHIAREQPMTNITEISHLLYATAKVITYAVTPKRALKNTTEEEAVRYNNKEPPWARRLTKKKELLRVELY